MKNETQANLYLTDFDWCRSKERNCEKIMSTTCTASSSSAAEFTSYDSIASAKEKQVNLHSVDVDRCCSREENYQQIKPAACRVSSLFAETRTDIIDLDDDVRWFFEDTSDAGIDHSQQNIADVYFCHLPDNVNLESGDKMHNAAPEVCDNLPLMRNVNMNALHVHDKCDCLDLVGHCVVESLCISNCQEFCKCSALNSCASVRTAAEHSKLGLSNAVKPNADSQKLLPNRKYQEPQTDINSAAAAQSNASAVSEGIKLSFPSLVVNQQNFKKVSRTDKSLNKPSLHHSQVLAHSRHFQSLQSPAFCFNAGDSDFTQEIMSNYDGESVDILLSGMPLDLTNNKTVKNDRLFEVTGACLEEVASRAHGESKERLSGYFSRLKKLAMCLSHGDDDLMHLAVMICCRQLELNPAQTWLVISLCTLSGN